MASSGVSTQSGTSERHTEWGRHSTIAFEEAAAVLDLEPWIVQRLRHPAEETTSYLQVPLASGDTVCVPFFQVLHSAATGQSIGGLGFAPDLQVHDCAAVAMERTWQAALLGLPFGGAAYGLVCDPNVLSEKELLSLVRSLARQMNNRVAPSCLLPGSGCCREFMGTLFGELKPSHNVTVTGKPNDMAGLDPDEFAAEGIAAIVSAALRQAGKPFIGARVAIQGFGSLARIIGRRLIGEGMKIVAVTDNSGGLYRPDGLLLDDICTRFAHEQVLFGYAEADRITRAELIKLPGEVLVLASGENELRERNSHAVTAKLVIEAGWSAVSDGVGDMLSSSGISCIPWCVATAGTLLAGYFEGQSIQILSPRAELLAKCYGIVEHAFEEILKCSTAVDCSCERATYQLGVEKSANYLRCCTTHYGFLQ